MTDPTPRRVLSLGAGVQSTTLFLMGLEGDVEPFELAVFSWDEIGRMKPPQRKWVTNEYPLIDRRLDRRWCHRRLAEFGWTAPRSACVYCPYHSDAEWRHLRDNAPDDFAEAIRIDREMREVHAERQAAGATSLTGTPFVHRSMLPLEDVDFRTEEDRGQGSLFGEECEGLCGI